MTAEDYGQAETAARRMRIVTRLAVADAFFTLGVLLLVVLLYGNG